MPQVIEQQRNDDSCRSAGSAAEGRGIVRRTALVNRLRAARSNPVALVVAPVGYGKTTLLEQWAARHDRRFVWLSHASLEHDAAALHELLTGSEPVVLAVDDVHLLGPPALAAVSALTRLLDGGSMIVLAGRSEPRLPPPSVPVLRARGELLELGRQDLALTWREARLVAQELGSPQTDQQLTRLVQETEGWPAAIHLAASTIGYGGLQAACLGTLTPGQRAFLRRTSILDRLDRSLCDAVLGQAPGAGETPTPDELGDFLVPLDHRRRWFRCHRLFRGLLRTELEAEEPALVPVLHERAAQWLEAHGDAESAVDHARAAGDTDRFMHIFATTALTAHQEGHDSLVEGWIRQIDAVENLDRYPAAAVLAARLHAHRGRGTEVARYLAAARRGLAGIPAAGDGPIRARIALVHAGTAAPSPSAMLSAAKSALVDLAPDDPWLPYGLLLQGTALALLGEDEQSAAMLDRASRAAEHVGAAETRALALAERALLADTAGEHAEAEALLEQAEPPAGRSDGFGAHALTLAASVRVLLRHGHWSQARRSLAAGKALVSGITTALPWLAVQVRLELVAGFVMLRDSAAARVLLDEVDEIFARHPDLGRLGEQRDRLQAEVADMPSPDDGRTPLTGAELRLLPLLATHLSFREIGALFFLSRHTVKTQAMSAYRKLGASSRSEAVQRAEQLGLIDPAADAARALIPTG